MSPDLKQLFNILFVLLREKKESCENFKAGLQRVVILLYNNRQLQNEMGKLFEKVYAKLHPKHQGLHSFSYGVIVNYADSLVQVETSKSEMKGKPARAHTGENKDSEDRRHFHMKHGTAKSCMLVVFACRLLLELYSLWSQSEFLLVSNNNSTTGLVTYKIEPNSQLLLLSDTQLNESLHFALDDAESDASFADVLYSNEFVLEPLDELILQNSPEQISTLTNVRLCLDYHVLYTNSKLGGVRGTKPHAHTLQDIWKTYTVVKGTEVSTLKWDLAGKPAALKQVRANYHARVKTVLRSALKTIGMYFENGNIPPVITEYAQQASTHQVYVKASSRKLRFEWVLIRDQNNTNDIDALNLFIANICDTLEKRTDPTKFEKSKLNMALLFKKVYTELKNESAGLCATINAPELWQSNHTKPAPISMHDLFTDAFTDRLTQAKMGEKHDVFIYEMVTYNHHLVEISHELKKTRDDIEMHVLFEVFLQTLSFQCTEHTNFALKPVFIGYVPGDFQQTHDPTRPRFPHYIDFAQSDHLLYQLVPLLMPRKWKAVSRDAVRGMTLAAASQVLQFADFEQCFTYNLDFEPMFAPDTYEFTRDAYAKHQSTLFYDNMYMQVSNGVEPLFLVPYTGTNIDPTSFLSAIVPMLRRELSSNVYNNFMHARSRIFSKIPFQLQVLVSIVQDQIVPKVSWDKLKIISTAVFSILGSRVFVLQFMMQWFGNMFDRVTRNFDTFYYVVANLLIMICVLFNFLNITSSAAQDIPRLEALISSFDVVGFFDIIVDLFFTACNMYQFSVECGDSFSIPDTLGFYHSNMKDHSRQQELRDCFLNKNTVDDLVSTMRKISDELEAQFDHRAGGAESVHECAEIVVGYCRVLSLRMLVLYLRRRGDEQSHSTELGTFKALVQCDEKLTQFYLKNKRRINDDTICDLKVNTQTTVIQFKQFFRNKSKNSADLEDMQKQIQTLLSSVNSPMENGGNTIRAVLENVTFLMLGFFVKQRACLVMFALCGEGQVQRRAQHMLYDCFKYQLLLPHRQPFAQLLAFGTAVFEISYYGSLLYYYYARPPGTFVNRVRLVPHGSDDVVTTFRHASGTPLKLRVHRSLFSDTLKQIIESTYNVYIPLIVHAIDESTEHDGDGAGSGERTPSTPPAARAGRHARPGAAGSKSSGESAGEDSDSGSDAPSREQTEDIMRQLLSLRPEASVEQVNEKLNEIFTSLQKDRAEKKTDVLLKLKYIFRRTSFFHKCDSASFEWYIQILTERVLNTSAKLDINGVHDCLTFMNELQTKCAKTDTFKRKLEALRRALVKRLQQRSTCHCLQEKKECLEKMRQLLQWGAEPES